VSSSLTPTKRPETVQTNRTSSHIRSVENPSRLVPMPVTFTLAVAATLDGFIARGPGHSPADWVSAEEQEIFLREVEAADWSIMGRGTHEAADRPERRRIIFSTSGGAGTWRRPTQIWLDPMSLHPRDLPALVQAVLPLERGLILGGTTVHDWFHEAGCIDRVMLTVEPVRFGKGLGIFSGQPPADPVQVFSARGYVVTQRVKLNAAGTQLLTLRPGLKA